MGVNFEQAPIEVHQIASEVLQAHHPELRMTDGSPVKLCILMAFRGDDADEPAVMLHGYPCYAKISIIPLKQRVDKRADAEIIIDREEWDNNLSHPQQRALLDHEITHLEIQKDENGFVKTDDVGRPKLKLKVHDWHIGGFRSIAQRYGSDALEVVEARKFQESYGDVALKREAELFAS